MVNLQKKQEKLLADFSTCADMIKGSISAVCGTCKRARCICPHKPTQRSYRLTYKDQNQKTQLVYVPIALLKEMKRRVYLFEKARNIMGQLIQNNIKMFKLLAKPDSGKK